MIPLSHRLKFSTHLTIFSFFSFRCTVGNCGKEFKLKAHLVRHFAQAHHIAIRSGSPRPIMKTRSAFYLQTTITTKLSRKLCRSVIKSKKAARQPSYAISLTAVKAECEFLKILPKINLLTFPLNFQLLTQSQRYH